MNLLETLLAAIAGYYVIGCILGLAAFVGVVALFVWVIRDMKA